MQPQHPAVDAVAAPGQAGALGQLGRLVEGGAGRGQVAEVELEGGEVAPRDQLQRPVVGRGRPGGGVAQQRAGGPDVAEAHLLDGEDHQGVGLVAGAAGGPGHGQGLLAPAPGPLVVAGRHQRPSKPGRHPGPQGRGGLLGNQLDRAPAGLQHLRFDLPQLRLVVQHVVAETLVGSSGPQRVGVLVDRLDRGPGQADSPPELAGLVGRLGGPQQQLDPVDAGHGGRVRHPVPQLQRLGQVAVGLGRGGDGGGVVGRPDQGGQPSWEVVAGQAVPGQLGGRPRGGFGVAGDQQARVGSVQAGPLPGKQVAVDGLLEQGMAEPVALGGRVGDQHLPGDGLAQAPLDLGLLAVRGRHQQPVADSRSGHRGYLEHLPGQLRQRLDAGQEHVG